MEIQVTRGENAKTRLTVPVDAPVRLKLCQADLVHEECITSYAKDIVKVLRPLNNTLRCTIIMFDGRPRVMHGSVAGNPEDAAKLGLAGAFGPEFKQNEKGFRKPKEVSYADQPRRERTWVHLLRNGLIAAGALALYGVAFTLAFKLKPGEIQQLPTWAHIVYLLLVGVTTGWMATKPPKKYPHPQQ